MNHAQITCIRATDKHPYNLVVAAYDSIQPQLSVLNPKPPPLPIKYDIPHSSIHLRSSKLFNEYTESGNNYF